MNAKLVLFATDFSELSKAALATATSLASESQGRLLIVHVQEPVPMYGPSEVYFSMSDGDHEAQLAALRSIVPSNPTVPFTHHLLIGNPADEIVRLAEAEHANLIVIGTHGRTGLLHLLMGSVAERVVRMATCDVLTVKAATAKQPAMATT